ARSTGRLQRGAPSGKGGIDGVARTASSSLHPQTGFRRWMMTPLRIAQVAPLYERVPPLRYGGAERGVSYTAGRLVEAGHDVTLFASGDSRTRAELVPGAPRGLRLEPKGRDPFALHLGMLLQVYDRAGEFDVIHCHTDYLGLPLARASRVPTVLTLHGRLDLPEIHPVYRSAPNVGIVSVSDAQRIPLRGIRWAGTVYHGLPA